MILVLITGLQSELNDSVFDETYVEKLTADTFVEYVEQSSVIVMFYTEWSQKSKNFVDEYISIAAELEELIHFGALDCNEYEDICHEYEVRDFPTLIVFKNKMHNFYTGAKTANAILRSVKESYEEDEFEQFGNDYEEQNTIEFKNATQDFVNYIDIDNITENYPNSSHVLTSSCLILILTMIANIFCY